MVNPQSSSAEKVDKVDADDVRLTNCHLFKYILPVSSCGAKTLSFPSVLHLFSFANTLTFERQEKFVSHYTRIFVLQPFLCC